MPVFLEGAPPGASGEMSESGWSNGAVFENFDQSLGTSCWNYQRPRPGPNFNTFGWSQITCTFDLDKRGPPKECHFISPSTSHYSATRCSHIWTIQKYVL